MRAADARVLALAARYGRIAYVYLKNGVPVDWALSCKGAKSWRNAATFSGQWIAKFDPDVVIIEKPDTATRKKAKTKSLLRAMIRVAERSPAMVAEVKRVQHFKNKFDEADAWIAAFPDLETKQPKRRRPWEPEPRNLVFFEALALAEGSGFLANKIYRLAKEAGQAQ